MSNELNNSLYNASYQALTEHNVPEYLVDAYENARPGLGAIAEKNIRNEDTGWSKIIEATDESELTKTEEKTSSNSFMYRRIGG